MRTMLLVLLCALGPNLSAQQARLIDWEMLAKVEFVDKYFPDYEAWYLMPQFSEQVKALDGKKVIINGYLIPLDTDGGRYALSAYPFSACFFCGGAGPESVISLHFAAKNPRYKTDQKETFTGTLHLNTEDVYDFHYILREARPFEDN